MAWNCQLSQARTGLESEDTKDPSLSRIQGGSSTITLTFDMNKLQSIPFPGSPGSPGRVLVTMNPTRQPNAVQSSHVYYHPFLNCRSLEMTRHLHRINGVNGISFAGAWMGFGFHEDGFSAGTHAADIVIHGHANAGRLDLVHGKSTKTQMNRTTLQALLRILIDIIQWILT